MSSPFHYRDGVLHAEGVPLPAIAASVGTPAYVYSTAALLASARDFRAGLDAIERKHLAFAVKANPNLAVLRLLAGEGYGPDIVSGGEMLHALAAGMPASSIIFSGVGKTRTELVAALDAGIGQFNLELEEEGVVLARLAAARGGRAAAVLRVNPDVDAGTHAKISTGRKQNKFGVALEDAAAIYARLAMLDGLDLRGIAVHIGSQLSDLAPLEAAYRRVGALLGELRAADHAISHVDLGGGLGLAYRPDDVMPTAAAYGAMVVRVTRDWDVTLIFEPGRFIAGAAGVLLAEVLWVKPGAVHPFVIVDAAMNDLARPALYDAFHDFVAVRPTGKRMTANIAGPVCESGDTFATGREIDAVGTGDLAVFRTAGAYGATMASTYNCRALVPEVLVDGDRFAVVAERITPAAMLAAQHIPFWMAQRSRSLPGDARHDPGALAGGAWPSLPRHALRRADDQLRYDDDDRAGNGGTVPPRELQRRRAVGEIATDDTVILADEVLPALVLAHHEDRMVARRTRRTVTTCHGSILAKYG